MTLPHSTAAKVARDSYARKRTSGDEALTPSRLLASLGSATARYPNARKRLIGREPTFLEAPLILDDLANTASAGSAIAFSRYHDDLPTGSYGVMASFGAGYSLGSVLMQRR